MKKLILLPAIASAMILASCDPDVDDIGMPSGTIVSESELEAGFSVAQYSDEACTVACDTGNYFYFTSPAIVKIYQVSDEGTTKTLTSGAASGIFTISPARGSDSNVTYYVSTQGYDGSTVTITRTAYVTVAGELTSDMLLLASDKHGYKVWKWDTSWREDGGSWGNAGYDNGGTYGAWTGGIWWACAPADLIDQSAHSGGSSTGEEDPDVYMYFYDDNEIETYLSDGTLLRSSATLTLSGYDGTYNQASLNGTEAWCLGTLKTDAGSIIWPYQINAGGTEVGDFEVMVLNANELQLIYAAEGTGSWSECTWWAFRSVSDPEASLTNYDTKTWKWDTEWRDDGGAWGNGGYTAGTYGAWSGGIWWACAPADLVDQLGHSDTGVATGEEDPDAYMIFDYSASSVNTYAADGTLIRSGEFSFTDWGMGEYTKAGVDGTANYAMGTLSTTSGSILFPFQINAGGVTVGNFEVVYLDKDQMQLVYAAEGTGNWSECTWWAFRAEDAFTGTTSSDSSNEGETDNSEEEDETDNSEEGEDETDGGESDGGESDGGEIGSTEE